jgi:hypothetical protein
MTRENDIEKLLSADFYEKELKEFVEQQKTVFVINDAIDFLGMDLDSDGARYAIPTLTKALQANGCKIAKLTVFIPPQRLPRVENTGENT